MNSSRNTVWAIVGVVAVVALVLVAVLLIMLRQQTAATTTAGKVIGSGKEAVKEFDLSGFERVEANAGFQVDIKPGDYSVKVWTDDNVIPYLNVSVSGDTLRLDLKSDQGNSITTRILRAEVKMPELIGVNVNGGSNATVTGFTSDKDLEFELNGGGRVTGDMTGANTKVESAGGGRLELTGQGGNLDINASGGSMILLSKFAVQDVKVNLSGGGRTEVNASGAVTGEASGGAMLQVSGNPSSVNVKTSGGSEVQSK
jgi:hypothetical protein